MYYKVEFADNIPVIATALVADRTKYLESSYCTIGSDGKRYLAHAYLNADNEEEALSKARKVAEH